MNQGFWKIIKDTFLPLGKGHSVSLGIQAAGLCCSVGYHLKAATCAMRANVDHFQHSEFLTREGEPLIVARLPDKDLWGQPRLARWLQYALQDCLQDCPGIKTEEVPLIWIAPEAERAGNDLGWHSEIFDLAIRQLGLSFHEDSGVLPQGRAGLAAALSQVVRYFSKKPYPYIILAGVDSYLDAQTINDHLEAERLQISDNTEGFIPGEGAAAILFKVIPADQPGLRIIGYGQAQEAGRLDGSQPNCAKGMTEAIRNALQSASRDYNVLQFRASDQHGESFFSRESTNAISRVAPVGGNDLELITLTDSTGNIGAATGPAMLAYLAAQMPLPSGPGHCGLLHLANDNGLRCAAIIEYQPA